MKNNKIFLLLACTLVAFLAVSCGKPKIKTIRGLVTSIEMNGDTLKTFNISSEDGAIVFDLKDARYNEGIMLRGDSVIVDYINGRKDTARALVVTVLAKTPHYIDISKDTTEEVKTISADSIKQK